MTPPNTSKLVHLPTLLVERFGRGLDTSEARRRIAMGRVWIDGVVCRDLDIPDPGDAKIELGDGLPHRGLTLFIDEGWDGVPRW